MPVCVPTPVAPMERCDYLPWISSAFEDDLPLDIDGMSFDHITNVLSRCATPPPESMAASPMESAMTSPSQSRCPSPIHVSFFLDSLFEYDELDSSATTSLASTPFSSSPASPDPLAHTAPCTPATSHYSPSSTSYSSPCSPTNSNMATIASLKQQARRLSKSGELCKPMKAKKMAKDAAAVTSPSASIAALCLSNATPTSSSSSSSFSSSSSSSSASAAANKLSKRNKAVALASKRDSHNISERNRRQELKLSFNVLQNIVPNLISASRAHTGTVLKETIAYIVALQQQEDQLIAAKNALLAEQSMLLLSQ